VHEIDHSPLQPNPAMGAAIAKLPGRKLILTNGSVDHVDAVLGRLGISHHFDGVFDIVAADLEPKPAHADLSEFLKLHDVDPAKAAMFEDLARNWWCRTSSHDHGAGGARRQPGGGARDLELGGPRRAHVDHVTDDLTGFLQRLKPLISPRVVPA